MSLKTAFLNLFKPEAGDKFSITGTEGYNKNMDLIDAAVKKNADDISTNTSAISQLNSDIKSNYMQRGYGTTINMNGYFRAIEITFKTPYKSGTYPAVFATIEPSTSLDSVDCSVNVTAASVTNTGCKIFVGDKEGRIANRAYKIFWIAQGAIE